MPTLDWRDHLASLSVVPMFHINAWYIPYATMVAGAKLALSDLRLDDASLYELMDAKQVTLRAGVPTINPPFSSRKDVNP